ncbi:MAG TPA: tetratricopeptide repeat protein [Terriglobales bacterium]|nr:tetratricopeptide repeat protein [Terriglobales bacterium]
MGSNNAVRLGLATIVALTSTVWTACNSANTGATSPAAAGGGKVPVTTVSADARKEFLEGRDLSERLLAQDSLQHFDKALALDPDFASAELARANNSPTAKEFFEHLNKAVGLAVKASDGEKLFILANQAGANGDVARQKDILDQLLAAYPNDERAQFALGNYYFGQQAYGPAIDHYKKATELAPNYSPAYNIVGYAYRQQDDYAHAEQSFKRYTELIPNDPNPYDSYGELLLKMGRFDDSIVQYRKALAIDPHFVPSHFGISADLTYMGKPQEAEAELARMKDQARNDGELRTAFFGLAVVAADSGKLDKALQQMDREYDIAKKKNDLAAMAADLQAKGNILAEMQNYGEANQQFERSLKFVQESNLSQEIKDNAKLLHHYNLSALAIGKKDYAAAKTHAEQFRQGAEASKNSAQVKLAHELAGRILLAEKDYEKAIAELERANLQDPRNLYRLGQAHDGKGERPQAQEFYRKAAKFNSLPALNYAFIRTKAEKLTQKT